MPTYGYECTECADQFEIVQSIKDDALTTCEKCGGKLRKRVYPVGISFKGSGFYVNDYKGAPPPSKAGGEGSKSGGSSEPAKSETAPAADSAPKSEPAKTETAKAEPAKPVTPSAS